MAAPCPCAAVAEGPGLRAAAATASDWLAERQPEERGWGLEEGRERERGRVRPVWLAGWEGERERTDGGGGGRGGFFFFFAVFLFFCVYCSFSGS